MTHHIQKDNPFRRAARGVFWGGFAAIAVVMAVQVAATDKGRERLVAARAEAVQLAGLYQDMREADPFAVASAEAESTSGQDDSSVSSSASSSETRALRARIARLEEQFGAITGSLGNMAKRDAAAPPPVYSMLTPAREESRQDVFAAAAQRAGNSSVTRTGFAVVLAEAEQVGPLERRWKAVSDKYGPYINGLEPHVQLSREDGGARLVLLAGPLGNAGDAARLCARLMAEGESCRTVPMAGPTMALTRGAS